MKKNYVPRRGDVIRLDFNPQTGHEQAGRRPALVLSPDEYNRKVGLVVVCPITSQGKDYPWEVVIPRDPHVRGIVLADQVKNLDWRQRRAEFICAADSTLLDDVIEKAFALLAVRTTAANLDELIGGRNIPQTTPPLPPRPESTGSRSTCRATTAATSPRRTPGMPRRSAAATVPPSLASRTTDIHTLWLATISRRHSRNERSRCR